MDRTFIELDIETEARLSGIRHRLIEVEDRLLHAEIRRDPDAFAAAQRASIRRVFNDYSHADASTDQQLTELERRLLEIEKRLHIPPPLA
jgi:hypothetical protein